MASVQQQHTQKPGGLHAVRPVDDTVSDIAMKVKPQIEAKMTRSLTTFEPKQVSTQVSGPNYRLYGPTVAGTNYFIKIHIGNGEHIHARIYQDLGKNLSLHSIQSGKSASDPIEYF